MRAILVVPGHRESMHRKAAATTADEVVFDLEDAVPAADKAQAREIVLATLTDAAWRSRRVAVRVNPSDSPHQDGDLETVAALDHPAVSVVVPKAERPADLQRIAGLLPPGVCLQALIETPRGLLDVGAIADTEAVDALILGYADLAAALRRRRSRSAADAWAVQQEQLLTAARAAGIRAVDGPFFAHRDARGLATATRAVAALGFDAKWAIHPDQLPVIAKAFGASSGDRAWAERVLAALRGGGAAELDGQMVDEAMVRQAHALLEAEETAPDPQIATVVAPPFYDDVAVGDVYAGPGLTLTSGHAAVHQAVIGDRLRLALDAHLFEAVTGRPGLLAHPALVCDVAIGQSTQVSGRVLGNLFYRGLGGRPVTIGTTLRTRTEVVARRDASRGRGIVALHVTTRDADGAPVLDFWRCPLLPGDPRRGDDHAPASDDLTDVGRAVDVHALVPTDWTLDPLRQEPLGRLFGDLRIGDRFTIEAGETVTGAPEIARLSLNLAMTHTDPAVGAYGQRLVYGGHVIGVAAAHLVRALPDLATILAWESCDHLGPTFEGDVLRSRLEIESLEALADGGLVGVRVHVAAQTPGEAPHDVLDWKLVALLP